MRVTLEKTIEDLKTEFAICFNNLRIDFYSIKHEDGTGTKKKHNYDSRIKINEITTGKSGEIDLSPNKTVLEVEQEFEDKFGLFVQIFRKSGDTWIQSTNSDSWTLEKQNNFNLK